MLFNSDRPYRGAALLSLLVYLIPIIGPHAFAVLGLLLVIDIGMLGDGKGVWWVMTDLGFAIMLQLLAALTFAWILSGRRWRWLLLLPIAPSLIWIANVLYLVSIPSQFLIEQDTAAELRNWEVACKIANAHLAAVRAGVQLELPQANEAWITQEPGGRHLVLTMPGCRLSEIGLDRSNADAIDYVAAGGAAVYRTHDKATGRQQHWFKAANSSAVQPLEAPGDDWWAPILSRRADYVAWLESERAANTDGFSYNLVMQPLAGGATERIILSPEASRHPELLSLDRQAGEIVLSNNFNEIVATDLRGAVKWGPVQAGPIEHLSNNYRRLREGWVAWDSYREQGRYRIHWSVFLGDGSHEVLKGRQINDVALDPWGRYIAVSVSSALNIGDIQDAVYVLRLHDGAEVYRRYLGRHARSELAFLGPHFVALSVYQSAADAVVSHVEVLRVPGPAEPSRVARWLDEYEARIRPVLPLFVKFDESGLGEEDCDPFVTATDTSSVPAPDEITADFNRGLNVALQEALRQCERWDPSTFVDAVLEVERLIGAIEDHLVYEHGVEVFPETSLLQQAGQGYRITPLVMPDGRVRAKRDRSAAP